MQVRDYNGPGEWGLDAVRRRYLEYAGRAGQPHIRDLTPVEHVEGDVRWVYPVMEEVIAGIKAGDLACIELGVEFIESRHRQAFGRILHANTARALRRAPLTLEQVARLRTCVLRMLATGQVPHEYHEYAKLLRSIGLGDSWAKVRQAVDEANPYVMRYVRYLERHASPEGASNNVRKGADAAAGT